MQTVKHVDIGDGKTRPVLRLPFSEMENAFLIISFKSQLISKEHIHLYTKYQEPYYPGEPFVTFFYAGTHRGAEWAPEYGPIMTYTRCSANWTGESFAGQPLKAKEHWYYDFVEDNALAWSQLAVEEERLPYKLSQGNFLGIFTSLRKWASSEDKDDVANDLENAPGASV